MNTEVKNTETLTKTAQQQVVLKPGFHAKQGSTVTLSIEPSGASFTPSEDYKVDQLTYDANGNIQSLRRNQSSSNGNRAMDDLTYHYNTEKPNQLQQVTDAVTASTNAGDITSQYSTENYEYNNIGQLVRNNAEGINYTYNASGLVTEVNTRYVSVQFYYNDRNQRVRKVVSRNGQPPVTTVYVRDAAGTPMAIYRNGTLVEHTVYGASRLGVYKRQSNATHKTSYELTDHLGNVRAVVSRANTSAITGTDYYPFGMPMPLRNSLSDYRYAYQGQEKDPETGKEAFELRLWDARIGRWLTTDPYSQFSSPYLGMGNNPVRFIDPDGGACYDTNDNLIPCPDNSALGGFDNTEFNIPSNQDLYFLDEVVISNNKQGNITGNLNNIGTISGLGFKRFETLIPDLDKSDFLIKRFDPKFETDFLNSSPSTVQGNAFELGHKQSLKQLKKLKRGVKGFGFAGTAVSVTSIGINAFNGNVNDAAADAVLATGSTLAGKTGFLGLAVYEGTIFALNNILARSELYNRLMFGTNHKVYIERSSGFFFPKEGIIGR